MEKVAVWDWPVRVVHWLFVIGVGCSWWTAEQGYMDYHRYSGYTLLGLLVFRVYWGFAGSSTARFANFVKGPRAIRQYLTSSVLILGHNPLGALSVLALLGLLLTQVALGLFAVDIDGLESGPLSRFVSFETGRTLAEAHEAVFNVLLAVIGLHIAAIVFYLLVKRDNLVRPMILGWKRMPRPAQELVLASFWRFLAGAAIAGAAVYWIV